eukprot:4940596-Ditylum_brightwellii.AAC.1
MITEECSEEDDEEAIDQYLTAELILGIGTDGKRVGRVIKRSWGLDDGSVERYQANVIAEIMFAQVDEEGHQFKVLSEITDRMKDAFAIPMANVMIRQANGQMKPKITTREWELLVQFKDEGLE